jgi:hypothetical protein
MPVATPVEQERALQAIRQGLQIEAEGTYLIKFTCKEGNTKYCKNIILQSIEMFLKQLNASRARQAEVALQLYEEQRASYEQAMIDSKNALNKYIQEHPDALLATSPNPTLAELQRQYNADQARYEEVVNKINEIRMQSEATPELNTSFFRIVDPPTDARPYTPGLRDFLMNTAMGLMVAMLCVLALVVVGTWTDPTIHTLNDVKSVVMAEGGTLSNVLLGVVPYNRWLATLRRRAGKPRSGKKDRKRPGGPEGGAERERDVAKSPLLRSSESSKEVAASVPVRQEGVS